MTGRPSLSAGWALLLLAPSVAVGAGVAPAAVTVVALGDSTTAGTPFYRSPLEAPPDGEGDAAAAYPSALEKMRPGWRVLNRGVDGERADEVRARFDRDVLGARPRFAIILAGVNDAYQGRDPAATEADLLWMYERARKNGIEPVAATIMPFSLATPAQNEKIRRVNAWIRRTAAARGWALCDLHAAVAAPGDPDRLAVSPEGLHPDRAGYRAAARALAATIDARLARPASRR
jgi:lysophospholipase L1-like esterase